MLKVLKNKMRREGARVQNGALAGIIMQGKQKYNVPHSDIKVGMVKQRLKQNSTKSGPGQKSPTEHIKPYIVHININ
jgi:hypothetical protein